jgi:predicted DNA-binding transcriptional regulator AlpA
VKNRRFVAFAQLKSEYGIPYSRVWVGELVRRGQFPAPFKISANRVMWDEEQILSWKDTRPVWGAADAA